VAFTNVLPAQIEEELASQDIPMILNSTPGVYATQSGGGDGDARITIRGFSQRNIAVMLDGIPVNDMENGRVYWSNWFGLDAVTRSIQVQRGLGASKIAIPSVGGTMNILTKGIDAKKSLSIKQEVANDGFYRTTVGLTTGRMENGLGVTVAASYKTGNGWVDQAFTDGWFYYMKVEKKLGKHLLSLSGMGAPQSHGQRSYKNSIARFDSKFAGDLGITDADYYVQDNSGYDSLVFNPTDTVRKVAIMSNRGRRYNKHWGVLERFTISSNGDTNHVEEEIVNERINYYHKPQFALRDFWTLSDKVYISNIVYVSIGRGGGTRLLNSPDENGVAYIENDFDQAGQLNIQKIYNTNAYGPFSVDGLYSPTLHKSGNIISSSVNNHNWYGMLSTLTYYVSDSLSISGGIDLRSYRGEHYSEVHDLLGGDYYVSEDDETTADLSEPETRMKEVGDKIGYNDVGYVRWAGGFAQVEYKTGLWSTFLNVSGAQTSYKRVDYFKKKDLVLSDTTYVQGLGLIDTIIRNGSVYTINSPETRYTEIGWNSIPGFTVKGGANYNINEFHNVFFNTGYISKAPKFINVIDYDNKFIQSIENEKIIAFELGYSYRSKKFSTNLNGYYTSWQNKPVSRGMSFEDKNGDFFRVNINGMDALHMGAELDAAFKVSDKLKVEGVVSLGDWTWQSAECVIPFNENTLEFTDDTLCFDATGVHVGDAAQTQVGASVRYEFIKRLYVKARTTYFANHYADFNPFGLNGEFAQRESWIMPSYMMTDAHTGYKLQLKKSWLDFRLSVLNIFDTAYLADAKNNDGNSTNVANFDAASAGVFFGLGRRYNLSLKITI